MNSSPAGENPFASPQPLRASEIASEERATHPFADSPETPADITIEAIPPGLPWNHQLGLFSWLKTAERLFFTPRKAMESYRPATSPWRAFGFLAIGLLLSLGLTTAICYLVYHLEFGSSSQPQDQISELLAASDKQLLISTLQSMAAITLLLLLVIIPLRVLLTHGLLKLMGTCRFSMTRTAEAIFLSLGAAQLVSWTTKPFRYVLPIMKLEEFSLLLSGVAVGLLLWQSYREIVGLAVAQRISMRRSLVVNLLVQIIIGLAIFVVALGYMTYIDLQRISAAPETFNPSAAQRP